MDNTAKALADELRVAMRATEEMDRWDRFVAMDELHCRAAALIEAQAEAIMVKDEALRSMLLQHGHNLGTRLMAEANDLARAALER